MWNPNDYRSQKDEILKNLKNNDSYDNLPTNVPFMATIMGVPIIVIWTFVVEELVDWKEFANSEIKRLKIFYNIKD